MKPVIFPNADVVLKGPADMPECGDLTAFIEHDENGTQYLMSVWRPSIAEIRALTKGGRFVLSICGTIHPPVAIGVINNDGDLIDD